MGILPTCSALTLERNPFKTASVFSMIPGDSSMQSPSSSQSCVLETSPSGGSHGSWDTKCVVQTLCSSGNSWSWGFLSNHKVLCLGRGLWHEYVSFPTCFHTGIFSVTQYVGVSQLVSGLFFREYYSMCKFFQCIFERRENQVPLLLSFC